MNISIEFETGNAAFEDNPNEIEYVLEQVARKVSQGGGSLFDSNGNKIGKVAIELND